MNSWNLKKHKYIYIKKNVRGKQPWLKLIFENNLRISLNKLEEFLVTMRRYVNIDQTSFTNILVTLSEALTNSIIHGNKFHPSKFVYLTININSDFLSFSLEDEGSGFDLGAVKNPLSGENVFKPGGQGILIMKYLSDTLTYSKEGRKINITFLLK